MKITNWRRKLAASLVAGGLLNPAAAQAANLDTNLVINAGFENVDINTSLGGYNAVRILDWNDGSGDAFAYSHNGALDGAGATIPDYANGGIYTGGTAPAGTGSFYFTSNATPGDVTAPGQFSQNIDLSTGPSATLIAAGEAAVTLGANFSSYLGNRDFGTLHVDFLNAGGTSLGTAQVSDSDTSTWTRDTSAGLIPVGTATARVSVFGTPLSGGPDGYIDNVDVQLTAAENILMFLEVNTSTGVARLRNNTGSTIHIDYYEIVSGNGSGNSLNVAGWNSLQDQNLAGFPAGNGTGNGWEQAGAADSDTLSESYLTGNSGVVDQASISLGALFDTNDPRDLTFRYSSVTSTASLAGDFDEDGDVDGADFLRWQRSFPGTLDAEDLANWADEFGSQGGPSGPGSLITGFVRYVTPNLVAVPEPVSTVIVALGLATALSCRPRL
jgi:hypothetical protein